MRSPLIPLFLCAGMTTGVLSVGPIGEASAQQRYPQYPGYGYPYSYPGQQQPSYPPPGYQSRYPQQPPPGNSEQSSRSDGSYPRQQYPRQGWPATSYGQQPPADTAAPPQLEVSVPLQTPYQHQPVVLKLRLVSNENLEGIEVETPATGALVFTKLEGPVTGSILAAGRQQIVNDFHYVVTPLMPGPVSIPPFRVKGKQGGNRKIGFELATPASILLDVQPSSEEVKPWLPLHGLVLQSYLEGVERLEVGQPITLIVNTSAVGATGHQLPSFESSLNDTGFLVYRERSENEGQISDDGRYLLGKRSEKFTLVPQHGGKLQIPELRIDWWNVDTHRAESSVVPIRQVVARGEPGDQDDQISDLFPGASSILLWVPLIGLFSVTIGFWVLAWLRNKRFIRVVEEEARILAKFARNRFNAFLVWLAPIRRLQKLRQLFVRSLPRSFRLWFCVQVVDGESDPEVWSYMLKFLSNKHLGIPPQLPMQELGDRLVEIHHLADEARMRSLMLELEQALYGRGLLDFPLWKKRFREQLRPSWLRKRARSKVPPPERLPRLNPDIGS